MRLSARTPVFWGKKKGLVFPTFLEEPSPTPRKMFTQQFTQTLHWKMPSGRSIAKEYRSRSRWLKQLNNTVNGGADSHEDY